MSAAAMTAATSVAGRRPTPTLARLAHYVWHSLRITVGDIFFFSFTVAMPVLIYLLMGSAFGAHDSDGTIARYIMVSMAAYGGLGAAITAGLQIQVERSSGWFRQLQISGLSAPVFLLGKVAVAMIVILPALIAVMVAGGLTRVHLAPSQWVGATLTLWLSLLPMIILGLVLGLLFKGGAAQAASTIVLLTMSMVGGLWMPLDNFPGWLQTVGRCLPSHWIAELGRWPLGGTAFPTRGMVVLGLWTLGLLGLGVLGYRRAVHTSQR